MPKLALLLILLGPAAGLLALAPADVHLQTAQKLIQHGRLKDAQEELKVAESLAPERQDIAALLAQVSPQGALTLAAAATPVADTATAAAIALRVAQAMAQADEAYHDSDLDGALAAWQRALQLAPGKPEALAGIAKVQAEAYHRDGDQPFDQSVADLYALGMREARKGRLVEAKKKLDEALALNPAQAQVKTALASLALGAQQQQAGSNAEQRVADGQAALGEGDWAKAGSAFQDALRQSPGLEAASAGLAQVRERGAAQAQKALKSGQAALAQSNWSEASHQFSLALAMEPDLAEAAKGKQSADLHAAQAKDKAAQRKEADKAYNAGVEAWSAGDLSLAASHFREVLQLDPDDAEAQKALQAVRKKLDERTDKDRADGAKLLEEGKTLEAHGDPSGALERYTRALAKDPLLAEAAKAKDRVTAQLKAP